MGIWLFSYIIDLLSNLSQLCLASMLPSLWTAASMACWEPSEAGMAADLGNMLCNNHSLSLSIMEGQALGQAPYLRDFI